MKKPIIMIIVLVAITLGFSASLLFFQNKPLVLQSATWFGQQAKELPAFSLVDHHNQPFDNQSVKGKWQLLFFGYTHCPDICPDTLNMLSNMMKHIDDESVKDKFQVTFVSVDPERDDLVKMKTYVEYFNNRFVSARADIDKVNILTDALGILHYIEKSDDGSNYEVAHSGALALLNPQGQYAAVFSSPHDSKKIAHDLTQLSKL